MELKRNRPTENQILIPIFFLLLLSLSLCSLLSATRITSTVNPDRRLQSAAKAGNMNIQLEIEKPDGRRGFDVENFRLARRGLGGLGSSPPRCTSKCGKCSPCKPIHVPVPPGTPVTAEYYPEAWRCKCGNKLYMP